MEVNTVLTLDEKPKRREAFQNTAQSELKSYSLNLFKCAVHLLLTS